MNALTWTRHHLPHRRQPEAARPRRSARALRIEVAASVLAAYLVTMLALWAAAVTLFGMSAAQSWGFALGVASYILLFGSFIGALTYVVVNNIVDDPSRR